MPDRSTGKIARLPYDLRIQVNRMLRDGVEQMRIIEWLAQNGHAGINNQNITNWYQGGYELWLKEQARLEDMREKRLFALEVVKQNEGSQIHEAGLQLAASQIYEVLMDYDIEKLKKQAQDDPENFTRIVNALVKLSDGGLKYERYRAEVAASKSRIEAELGRAKAGAGLTPETLEKIERELKLL